MKIISMALGGAGGTILRYVVSGMIQRESQGLFPWGTLGVNLIGSFVIGLLWGLFEDVAVAANVRAFLLIGMLGAFTTFSTFALENVHLLRDGEVKLAVINVLLSNLLGITLAFGGYVAARFFLEIFKSLA